MPVKIRRAILQPGFPVSAQRCRVVGGKLLQLRCGHRRRWGTSLPRGFRCWGWAQYRIGKFLQVER